MNIAANVGFTENSSEDPCRRSEVDFLPNLKKVNIAPENFQSTKRCSDSQIFKSEVDLPQRMKKKGHAKIEKYTPVKTTKNAIACSYGTKSFSPFPHLNAPIFNNCFPKNLGSISTSVGSTIMPLWWVPDNYYCVHTRLHIPKNGDEKNTSDIKNHAVISSQVLQMEVSNIGGGSCLRESVIAFPEANKTPVSAVLPQAFGQTKDKYPLSDKHLKDSYKTFFPFQSKPLQETTRRKEYFEKLQEHPIILSQKLQGTKSEIPRNQCIKTCANIDSVAKGITEPPLNKFSKEYVSMFSEMHHVHDDAEHSLKNEKQENSPPAQFTGSYENNFPDFPGDNRGKSKSYVKMKGGEMKKEAIKDNKTNENYVMCEADVRMLKLSMIPLKASKVWQNECEASYLIPTMKEDHYFLFKSCWKVTESDGISATAFSPFI